MILLLTILSNISPYEQFGKMVHIPFQKDSQVPRTHTVQLNHTTSVDKGEAPQNLAPALFSS